MVKERVEKWEQKLDKMWGNLSEHKKVDANEVETTGVYRRTVLGNVTNVTAWDRTKIGALKGPYYSYHY
jgi:hypothetical protein